MEAILRALGYYQVRLFDEISAGLENNKEDKEAESQVVTAAIKKIHKTLEEKEKETMERQAK
jgi:hypothetical protein